MRQKGSEESGARYEVIKELNLSISKEMTGELNQFKKKQFSSMSITDRGISFNNRNFNFFNGHSWPVDIAR